MSSERLSETLPVVHDDVACTVCGCVCDDLTVTVTDGRVTAFTPDCPLARGHFLGRGQESGPVAWIDGRPASLSDAVAKAATLLTEARLPLVYGLSRSSTPGHRAAVALADTLGAVIDTTASRGHAGAIEARQQVGESVATLGETAVRCDLVIYWGSNPLATHPRHLERYGMPDRPRLRSPDEHPPDDGTPDRHLVVVDVHQTTLTDRADDVVLLPRGTDLDAIQTLRLLVKAKAPNASDAVKAAASSLLFGSADGSNLGFRAEVGDQPPRLPMRDLANLADLMTTCRAGVVFFDVGLTRHSPPSETIECLLRLVTELNAFTRFYARRMRVPGDVAGADSVLAWQTGYPFAVDFRRGYPRFGPGEFSASVALARRETDVTLVLGADSVETLPSDAYQTLMAQPKIVIDANPPGESPDVTRASNLLADAATDPQAGQRLTDATVWFRTGVYGVHEAGTAYRMDEVPIPLRPIVTSDLPRDADVLTAIGEAIRNRMESSAATADAEE